MSESLIASVGHFADYPEVEVMVFRDFASLYRILKIEKEILGLRGEAENKLHDEREALTEKLVETAFTLTLKGVPPRLTEDIDKVVDKERREEEEKRLLEKNGMTEDEINEFVINRTTWHFIKAHVVQVRAGDKVESPITDETLSYILDELPMSETERIINAISDINPQTMRHELDRRDISFS